MTCAECKDELLLSFGQQRCSQDVESHLAGCAECRQYTSELAVMAGKLDIDSSFYPDRGEAIRLAARVERALDRKEPRKVTSLHWLRYAVAAASIVLLVGIALLSQHYRSRSNVASNDQGTDSNSVIGNSASDSFENTTAVQETELGDSDIRALLKDYTSSSGINADERLLDGITEAEMNYLKENLTVKDLL